MTSLTMPLTIFISATFIFGLLAFSADGGSGETGISDSEGHSKMPLNQIRRLPPLTT